MKYCSDLGKFKPDEKYSFCRNDLNPLVYTPRNGCYSLPKGRTGRNLSGRYPQQSSTLWQRKK